MNRVVKDERLTTMEAAMVLGIDYKTEKGKTAWKSITTRAKRFGLKPRHKTEGYSYEDIRILAQTMRVAPHTQITAVRTKLVELFREQLKNDGY